VLASFACTPETTWAATGQRSCDHRHDDTQHCTAHVRTACSVLQQQGHHIIHMYGQCHQRGMSLLLAIAGPFPNHPWLTFILPVCTPSCAADSMLQVVCPPSRAISPCVKLWHPVWSCVTLQSCVGLCRSVWICCVQHSAEPCQLPTGAACCAADLLLPGMDMCEMSVFSLGPPGCQCSNTCQAGSTTSSTHSSK
jgi:hypothetical protein